MDLYSYINIGMWLGWFTYWAIAARSATRGTSSERRSSRLIQLAAVVVSVSLLGARLVHVGLPGGPWVDLVGNVVTVLGLAFAIWARRHLGANWSGRVELKEGHRVVRSGPYAIVRHPIYTGILVAIVGSAIIAREVTAFGAVLVMLAAFLRKIRMEETVLLGAFGTAYEKYRCEVKALVPFVV